MTFSKKLIRLRKREGLSQEALAEILGVSRQAVSRWEQGTALPDGGKLLPCARHFGVSVDWLLDEKQGWEDLAGTGSAPVGGESLVICKNWHWYLSGGIGRRSGRFGHGGNGDFKLPVPGGADRDPGGSGVDPGLHRIDGIFERQ